MKILRADLSQAMLAVIRCRIFDLTVFYQKNTKIKIYRTIIFFVASFGCETWSLTRKKEYKLSVFKEGC
jgi:hypothetical protein